MPQLTLQCFVSKVPLTALPRHESLTTFRICSRDVYLKHVHGEWKTEDHWEATSLWRQPMREHNSSSSANRCTADSVRPANLLAARSADATNLQQQPRISWVAESVLPR